MAKKGHSRGSRHLSGKCFYFDDPPGDFEKLRARVNEYSGKVNRQNIGPNACTTHIVGSEQSLSDYKKEHPKSNKTLILKTWTKHMWQDPENFIFYPSPDTLRDTSPDTSPDTSQFAVCHPNNDSRVIKVDQLAAMFNTVMQQFIQKMSEKTPEDIQGYKANHPNLISNPPTESEATNDEPPCNRLLDDLWEEIGPGWIVRNHSKALILLIIVTLPPSKEKDFFIQSLTNNVSNLKTQEVIYNNSMTIIELLKKYRKMPNWYSLRKASESILIHRNEVTNQWNLDDWTDYLMRMQDTENDFLTFLYILTTGLLDKLLPKQEEKTGVIFSMVLGLFIVQDGLEGIVPQDTIENKIVRTFIASTENILERFAIISMKAEMVDGHLDEELSVTGSKWKLSMAHEKQWWFTHAATNRHIIVAFQNDATKSPSHSVSDGH